MRRRLQLVGLGLVMTVLVWPTPSLAEAPSCASKGYTNGQFWGAPSDNTVCYDGKSLVRSVGCEFTNYEHTRCCMNITTPVCLDDRAGLGSGEIFPKQATKPIPDKVPPLTFTPNVPIPRLFEGEQPVTNTLIGSYIAAFFFYFVGAVSILAVVMMMWGGFHYITSAGNAQRMRQGKEIIGNALIGLVLALTSVLLLRTVNPALVNFRALVPSYVAQILQPIDYATSPVRGFDCRRKIMDELPTVVDTVKKNKWDEILKREANTSGVDPYRLLATLAVESHADPNLVSGSNACGLMQVLPKSTANKYSCVQLQDPTIGIKAGAEIFSSFQKNPCLANTPCKHCADSPKFVHAAYNGGYQANNCSEVCRDKTVWQCGAGGYAETKCYVEYTDAAYNWLKANFTF